MPFQTGRKERSVASWQAAENIPLSIPKAWPLAIDCCLGQRHRLLPAVEPKTEGGGSRSQPNLHLAPPRIRLPRLNTAPAPEPSAVNRLERNPPICERWAPAPAADPVASFVRPASALILATVARRFTAVIEMPLGRRTLVDAPACPAPPAEPVTAFVCPSAVLSAVPVVAAQGATVAARIPSIPSIPSWTKVLPTAGMSPAHTAEPVAEFVHLSAALNAVPVVAAQRPFATLQLPSIACWSKILPTAGMLPAHAAEPVAEFVRLSAVLSALPVVAAQRPFATLQLPAIASWTKIRPSAGISPAHAAEPVAEFVRLSAVLSALPVVAVQRPFATLQLPAIASWTKIRPSAGVSPAHAAEPVAEFVHLSAVLNPLPVVAAQRPFATLQLPSIASWTKILPPAGMSPAHAAEPVAAFVRLSAVLTPAAMIPAQHPDVALQFPAQRETLPPAGARPEPTAEPVTAFIRPATALTAMATARTLSFAIDLAIPAELHSSPSAGPLQGYRKSQAAEPVASFLRLSAALIPIAAAPGAPRLQQPLFAAIEPLPNQPMEAMEPPAVCLRAMPSPAPEPVCAFMRSASQSFLAPAFPLAVPQFTLDIDVPHIPYVPALMRAGAAEPVMIGVYTRTGNLSPIASAAAIELPAVPGLARELLATATSVLSSPAEPAESFQVAAAFVTPVSSTAARCRVPEAAGFVLAIPDLSPAPGTLAAGLEAEPLESLLVASASVAQTARATVRLLNFTIAASQDLMAPGFDVPRLAPKVCAPGPASPRVITIHPIATLSVAAPDQKHERFLPALPHPGIVPVEFHAQRSHGVLFQRPEWKSSRLALLLPGFAMRPLFGKLEEPAAQPKPAPQEPAFIKTFNMPVRRPTAVLVLCGKIAAGVLLASSLWYAYAFRAHTGAGVEVAAAETSVSSSGRAGSSAAAPSEAPQGEPAATGPMVWVRRNIAQRAAVQVSDHFHDGMQGWGNPARNTASARNTAPAKSTPTARSTPPGWSLHPDGYITPGALALFRPSLNFKDYRFEFFGQIENKGMSWSVRAKDSRNYHAMKVAIVEAGLRPFVALVHWDVVDGKAGRQLRTPLNIMVHNDRPMQVAVAVQGNRLVTSIDGEEVDTFSNTLLASGGVGFFSETNERARLYWMKVSTNDDWLGHACAFLAGDDAARATAELRGPQLPADAPTPWTPGEENTTYAAVWAGLPYLRAKQRARASHTRRTDQWNT